MGDGVQLEVHGPGGSRVLSLGPQQVKSRLSVILRREGLALNTRCGERGLCQGCLIELEKGSLVNHSTGETVQADALRWLKACDYRPAPEGHTVLRVPTRSLLAHEPQVVTSFRLNVPWANAPLSPAVETSAAPLGAAIDIGTTTVVVAIVNMKTGQFLGQASALNAQIFLGDNVLTRIHLCRQDPAMVKRLQKAVVEDTLAPLLQAALDDADRGPEDLAVVVVAGNTTMLHLLAGINPGSMGVSPFTPVFRDYRRMSLKELGLKWASADNGSSPPEGGEAEVPLHLLPGASAYVGADVVAGVLASGLAYAEKPSLLLDLGTNGEIVLKHGESLWGCATAAGPAFEGAGLTCGVRAGTGAIEHIWFEPGPPRLARFNVIGKVKPIGLCGTAYIDFIANARRLGLLTPTGRFTAEDNEPGLKQDPRLGRFFVLVPSKPAEPIVITEGDIAALLQAKAAIAAGVACLLARAGLRSQDIGTVYLAGGFGFHMNVDSLLACGMLPDFQPEQIQLVGNTSLAGAYASLLDSTFLDDLKLLSERIQIVELNLDPNFESTYIDQLLLP